MENRKYSRQREVMLKVLRNTKSHPNADWIYTEVRKEIPNISLGTVYRNLSKLSNDGTIRKFSAREGGDCFDGDISEHSHLLCDGCGKIVDVFTDYFEFLSNDVEQKTGACVSSYSLILSGTCADCIKK